MRLALALGQRADGAAWPNPAVGCVLVRDGRIVGRGWTGVGGRPHAEAVALARAGAAARGATAYVTLEPCAHHGRTPPCCDALVAAGIARVVVPMHDPDPRVDGRGVAALRAAGVVVDVGCLEAEARRAHAGFLARQSARRPMVTLKVAASLDGRIASASGIGRWVTGERARAWAHRLRAEHDAVLVGSGTVLADDPAAGPFSPIARPGRARSAPPSPTREPARPDGAPGSGLGGDPVLGRPGPSGPTRSPRRSGRASPAGAVGATGRHLGAPRRKRYHPPARRGWWGNRHGVRPRRARRSDGPLPRTDPPGFGGRVDAG